MLRRCWILAYFIFLLFIVLKGDSMLLVVDISVAFNDSTVVVIDIEVSLVGSATSQEQSESCLLLSKLNHSRISMSKSNITNNVPVLQNIHIKNKLLNSKVRGFYLHMCLSQYFLITTCSYYVHCRYPQSTTKIRCYLLAYNIIWS